MKNLMNQLCMDVREIIRTLFNYKDLEIVKWAVCINHIYLCVSIPPKMSISNFMEYLKENNTLIIYDRHPELQSKWSKAF